MRESSFSQLLRIHLTKHGHWTRVENVCVSGMPDINMFINGRDVWIETKISKGNRIIFEQSQNTWHLKRARWGGDHIVLTRHKDMTIVSAMSAMVKAFVWYGTHKPYVAAQDAIRDALWTSEKPMDWDRLLSTVKSF